MSIFGNLLNKRNITGTTDLKQPDSWLSSLLGGHIQTKTGVRVSEDTALKLTAVFACVRVISEGVATLPLPVYQRLERGKKRARDHPLFDILQYVPNPEMTSFSLRETMQAHLLLWGNAYAEIEYNGAGEVKHLWPIPPNKIKRVTDKQGRRRYKVSVSNGESVLLFKEQVLHIPGLSLNGVDGLSPIGYVREAIGLGLATEEFGSKFFENGANIGGVAQHPGQLSDQGAKNLRESINETYGGLGKSHRLMLLEEGMKYEKIGIPPNDAQFLETRKFQTREIARFFNVRPHMIGDLDNATFSNIEHQGIEHVVHTLTPWLTRWEQVINTKLIDKEDRKVYFAEFVVDGLLRGDISNRYAAYAIGRQWGWLSANDVREKENDNPLPDEQGDMYITPMNMIPASQVNQSETSRSYRSQDHPEGCQCGNHGHDVKRNKKVNRKSLNKRQLRSAQLKNRTAHSFETMFADAEKRIVKREINDIKRALKQHLNKRSQDSFISWLDTFYDNFPDFIRQQMEPVIRTLASSVHDIVEEELGEEIESSEEINQFVIDYVMAFTARYIGSSKGQLKALMRDTEATIDGDLADELEERLDEWEERRPDKVAMRETVQATNALSKAFYIFVGVTYLRWVSMGSKSCSLCDELDGEVVHVQKKFVERDEHLEGEDGNDMDVQKPCGHGPLHDGCQCQVVAD